MRTALKYRSAPSRRAEILDLLSADGAYLSQAELCHLLGVSEMTIRRDARELEERGLLRVVAGGICRVREPMAGNEFVLRAQGHLDAKRRIAQVAIGMIGQDSTIALDAGTTMLEIARLLIPTGRLTVVTASLPVMCLLNERPGIELIGLGGVLHPRSQTFAGPATIEAVRHLRVAQLFLGAAAVRSGGTYEGNAWDSEIKRAMIKSADEVILVADSTKFRSTAIALVAPLSAVHVAVVDDGISASDAEMLQAAGVRVVTVPTDREATMANSETAREQLT